jgi:hypothetical protein
MESYCSFCTLDTIHRSFFVTRLIINKINKVQWVDFKLENVLISLHSLKTMGLGSIIFKEWRVTRKRTITLHSLKIMEILTIDLHSRWILIYWKVCDTISFQLQYEETYLTRSSDLQSCDCGRSYFVYNCLSFLRFLFGSYIAYPSKTNYDYSLVSSNYS